MNAKLLQRLLIYRLPVTKSYDWELRSRIRAWPPMKSLFRSVMRKVAMSNDLRWFGKLLSVLIANVFFQVHHLSKSPDPMVELSSQYERELTKLRRDLAESRIVSKENETQTTLLKEEANKLRSRNEHLELALEVCRFNNLITVYFDEKIIKMKLFRRSTMNSNWRVAAWYEKKNVSMMKIWR